MGLRHYILTLSAAFSLLLTQPAAALDYEDYPIVKLRTLDKITARTMTFEAKVGSTMKFGEIFIKVQTCRKPPPVQKAEAAAFLQIWETDTVKDQSRWIFSGWMFSSSPVLSAMDHPVYDVWVIDCLGKDPEALPPPVATPENDAGIVPANSQPELPPTEQLKEQGEAAAAPAATRPSEEAPAVQTPAAEQADPATSGEIPMPDAAEEDPVVEETVPASNMPADAVPATPIENEQPVGDEPVENVAPQVAPQPQPDVAPVEPAPEHNGSGSDSFQGIY